MRGSICLLALASSVFVNQGSEGGVILYASVVQFTPPQFWCAPDFSARIEPIRDEAEQNWNKIDALLYEFPSGGWLGKKRRELLEAGATVLGYPDATSPEAFRAANRLCFKAAIETVARNPWQVLWLMTKKGDALLSVMPGEPLDKNSVGSKPLHVMAGHIVGHPMLPEALFGVSFNTVADATSFFHQHYPNGINWFGHYFQRWKLIENAARIPHKRWRAGNAVLPGLSWIYFVAFGGLVIAMLSRSPMQKWHVSFGIALTLFCAVLFLTVNFRARYHLFLEPFLILYICYFADRSLQWLAACASGCGTLSLRDKVARMRRSYN
jgi:hypothetical protein